MDTIFTLSTLTSVIISNAGLCYVLRIYAKKRGKDPRMAYYLTAIGILFTGLLWFIVTITQHKLQLPKHPVVKQTRVVKNESFKPEEIVDRLLSLPHSLIRI